MFCNEKMENSNLIVKTHVAVDVMKNSHIRRHNVSLTHTHIPLIYVWVFTLHLLIILFWLVPYCQGPGEGQLGKHQADHPRVAL